LDCGSPAAAFAETALLSGSSQGERPIKKDGFPPTCTSMIEALKEKGFAIP
jgi:hypothetical protein